MHRLLLIIVFSGLPILTSQSHASWAIDLDSARALWKAGVERTVPEMMYMEWERTFLPELSAREIEQRRAEIANKPEHPDHFLLDNAARRLQAGGDQELIKAWHFDENRYRINIDTPYSKSSTHDDYSRNRSTAWSYAQDGAVTVVDLDSANAPPERDPTLAYSSLLRAARLLIHGGWGSGPAGAVPTDFQSDASGWRMVVETADGSWRYRIRGERSIDQAELLITESRLVECPSPTLIGTTNRFEEYAWNDMLGRSVPRVVLTLDSSGWETRRLELVQLSEVDADNLEAVLAIPSAGSPDATRGDRPVRVVMDFRPGTSQITSYGENGAVIGNDRIAASSSASGSLRGVGWVLAGLLVVLLVVLRLRARA